jgi:hypothetical protein
MGHSVCQPPAQVMRLRCAVPKIPTKSSVPPRSPLYKLSHLLTPSESTLPQLLIPLHFKSFISNTYKKPGRGAHRPASKFGNSSLPPRHSSTRAAVLVSLDLRSRGATDRATAHPQVLSLPLLDASSQISENTVTLSLFAATLTGRVKPKSCVCHSYKKRRGVGYRPWDRFPKLSSGRHRPQVPILSEGIFCSIRASRNTGTTHYPLPTIHFRLTAPPRPPICHPEGIEGSAFHSQALAGNRYIITSLLLCFFASPRHRTQERIMTSRSHEK